MVLGIGSSFVLLLACSLILVVTAALPIVAFLLAAGQASAAGELTTWAIILAAAVIGIGVLLSLVFIGVSAGLIWWGIQLWRRARALDQGLLASGIITGRWRRYFGRGGVIYQFTPQGMTAPITITQHDWRAHQRYQVGDAVRVRYAVGAPRICRLEYPES